MTNEVLVWDTYIRKQDGNLMHFDIMTATKDQDQVFKFGEEYLASKGLQGQVLSSEQCKFCHIEQVMAEWEEDLKEKGYFIYEMEGC